MANRIGPEQYTTIGTQKWQRRNLDVSTYRNGDVIPYVADNTEWANLTTGAWCWYNNDPELGKIYGKIYNGYAVLDPRGLAPQGWHIPNFSEYVVLGTFVENTGPLKSTSTLWNSPNTGATNSTGFNALPGGTRDRDTGEFSSLNTFTRFYLSTTNIIGYLASFILSYNSSDFNGAYLKNTLGCSVRCIKD